MQLHHVGIRALTTNFGEPSKVLPLRLSAQYVYNRVNIFSKFFLKESVKLNEFIAAKVLL